MRLGNSRRSSNIEDRRGSGPRMGRGGTIGVGTIVMVLIAMYFGVDPSVVLQMAEAPTEQSQPSAQRSGPPASDAAGQFVASVLGETEETWQSVFQQQIGQRYQEPRLVLFTGNTPTACGTGMSAMGPFYCPGDRKVYIDLQFFSQLKSQYGAPGDFAQAYVIAHEVGHHVQNLLGTMDQVNRARSQSSEVRANQLSVRLELQADCYAGLWAHHANRARQILEDGDIEEALNAASAIGDDTLQKRSQGRVVPDAFTHGSSKQRVAWFKIGLESGSLKACDTFANPSP